LALSGLPNRQQIALGDFEIEKVTDLRQTSQYAHYLRLQGWQVNKINGAYIFIRKLFGISIVKIQRAPITPEACAAFPRGVRIIYLEPLNKKQIPPGFKLKKTTFLPSKTLEINLKQSEEKILQQMKKDARYAIRQAQTSGISVYHNIGISGYRRAWRQSTPWRRWVPSLKSLQNLHATFGKNAWFLAAVVHHQIIAGTVILIAARRAYYYYAFTGRLGRQLLAQYLLVWEAIKQAKKIGCQELDFEGLYDQRFPDQSWRGFSHFKQSFGGREIEYPGCFGKLVRSEQTFDKFFRLTAFFKNTAFFFRRYTGNQILTCKKLIMGFLIKI